MTQGCIPQQIGKLRVRAEPSCQAYRGAIECSRRLHLRHLPVYRGDAARHDDHELMNVVQSARGMYLHGRSWLYAIPGNFRIDMRYEF